MEPTIYATPQTPESKFEAEWRANAPEQFASTAPFTLDKRATALAMMYTNEAYIADQVLPRVSVPGELFTWRQGRGEDFRRDDTRVGRTGQANRSEVGEDVIEAKTEDWAWEVPVPQKDIDNSSGSMVRNPIDRATRQCVNKLDLDREFRVRDLVSTATNFQPANPLSLAALTSTAGTGTNWSAANAISTNANSNPIATINNIIAGMFLPPTIMVMSWNRWIQLSMHPALVQAFTGANSGADSGKGMMPISAFENLFNIKLVLGKAWTDPSLDLPPGVNMGAMTRIWGDNVALIRVDPSATADESSATWGFTAEWMGRRTYRYQDPRMGVDGGTIVKVGEHVKEIISSKIVATVITNAFA